MIDLLYFMYSYSLNTKAILYHVFQQFWTINQHNMLINIPFCLFYGTRRKLRCRYKRTIALS